ncbi:hypothetical protein [Roseibium sp.]|uniref:hypothetical protein n=1 Tax=Roseibium sp. TaxID=1936156 RepID=UPI003D0B0740
MSESASEPKVEDVLSSVRRLVSGELPRKPRPNLPEGPGALVLTDAQRVSESPRVTSKSLEDRIAELEAAVGQQSEEFEPDGSEDQAQHRPDRMVYTRPPSSAEQENARRSTLRLSQIALVETGPANEDEGRGEAVAFTHTGPAETEDDFEAYDEVYEDADERGAFDDSDVGDEIAEAPMAEDVPVQRATPAEVAAFTNPDEVVKRLEARLAGGAEEAVQIAPAQQPAAPAEVAVEAGDDMDDEAFEDALNRAIEGDLQDGSEAEIAEEHVDEASAGDVPAVATFDVSDDTAAEMLDEPAAHDNAPETPDEVDAFETGDELGVAEAFEVAEEPAEDVTAAEAVVEVVEPTEAVHEVPAEGDAEDLAGVVHFDDTDQGAEVEEPAGGSVSEDADGTIEEASEDAEMEAEIPAATVAAVADAALNMLDDEAAARLLVARLIREELQGELGERITRNVRKLVRREIKRALTSQDLG